MNTFSGNFDSYDEQPRFSRKQRQTRKLAEEFSRRAVGNLDAVDAFMAEADGLVKWDDVWAILEREGWAHVEAYPYHGPDNTLLYESHRFVYKKMPSKKKFMLRHTDGEGILVISAGPVRVPYNLPELLRRKQEPLVLVEGEAGVNKIRGRGVLATCVQGQHWTDDTASPFANREVIVSMDNDDAGRKNTATAVEWLKKAGARSIRVPLLPGLGRKCGLDDWLVDHSVEDFWAISARTNPEPAEVTSMAAVPHAFPTESSIPMWDWLYGNHLLRGTVSGTAALGGSGKTSLSIGEALAQASGKPLHGVQVPRPLRVLLINLEDNRNAMDKRIAATMKHHSLKAEDVGARLFVKAKGELAFKIAKQLRGGSVWRNEQFIKALIAFLMENKIDVLDIDPFVSTHGVNENDNSAIREVVDCYSDIAETAKCAVHLWHHSRKANSQAATVDSARGASSFVDACRSVRILETMTKDEAQKLKIEHPGYYFRAFNGKLNFAPPTDRSGWFKFVSVTLDNAGPLFGDDIGVVEAWQHPAAKETDLSPAIIAKMMEAVGHQPRWREHSAADMWVGKAVAQILNLDPSDNAAIIKKAIKKLRGIGALKETTGKDAKRQDKTFIVAGDWVAPAFDPDELERGPE